MKITRIIINDIDVTPFVRKMDIYNVDNEITVTMDGHDDAYLEVRLISKKKSKKIRPSPTLNFHKHTHAWTLVRYE